MGARGSKKNGENPETVSNDPLISNLVVCNLTEMIEMAKVIAL